MARTCDVAGCDEPIGADVTISFEQQFGSGGQAVRTFALCDTHLEQQHKGELDHALLSDQNDAGHA